jgi:cardiolipin synthase
MHKRSYYMVNGITLYRLMAAPLLVLLVINNRFDLFKWLLAISFFTDALDGYLARRYHVISIAGSKLDSIADDLTIVVAMMGMMVFKREFLLQEITMIILLLVLFLVQTAIALIRYGKISSFHTYAAKIAAMLQGTFLLLLFFLSEPIYLLFYLTTFVTALELFEEIIIMFLLPQWETNVKGLYWIIKRKEKYSA